MPELPEVETIVRDLERSVRGATIATVRVLRPDLIARPSPEAFAAGLESRGIRSVGRRAKNIVFDLGDTRLVINLGMTGRVLVRPSDEPDPPYAGVVIDLQGGRRLVYHDVRRFGSLMHVSTEEWRTFDQALGYEPLDPGFTPATLHDLASRSRTPVKTWLMDQKRIVGVGNIYASEALFRAGIDPRTPARDLDREAVAALHAAIRAVLQEAIDFRGTTLLDYRDASGESGGFAERLRVYDRAGEPCRICATPIARLVQAGRSTFFCPTCQPERG